MSIDEKRNELILEFEFAGKILAEEEEEEEEAIVVSLKDITERKRAEEELKQKHEELSRFNKLTVDREMKMIELKKEINELCEKLGGKAKYNLDFANIGV